MWSAVTAAQEGLPYAYAHFFSAAGTRQAIEYYQRYLASSPPTATADREAAQDAIVAALRGWADTRAADWPAGEQGLSTP